jgi:hypothetical protein
MERLVGFDRKTVRRYVESAVGLGLTRDGGDEQLSDVFIGLVVEAVRPHRSDGHGEAWRRLQGHHDEIAAWVKDDLTAVKIVEPWPDAGSRSVSDGAALRGRGPGSHPRPGIDGPGQRW